MSGDRYTGLKIADGTYRIQGGVLYHGKHSPLDPAKQGEATAIFHELRKPNVLQVLALQKDQPDEIIKLLWKMPNKKRGGLLALSGVVVALLRPGEEEGTGHTSVARLETRVTRAKNIVELIDGLDDRETKQKIINLKGVRKALKDNWPMNEHDKFDATFSRWMEEPRKANKKRPLSSINLVS